jgi:hypothetical protein
VLVDVVLVAPIPEVSILFEVCAAAIGAAISVAATAAVAREICLNRCISKSPIVRITNWLINQTR